MMENQLQILNCSLCGKPFPVKLLNGNIFYQRRQSHTGKVVYKTTNIEQIPPIKYFCGINCRNSYFGKKCRKKF